MGSNPLEAEQQSKQPEEHANDGGRDPHHQPDHDDAERDESGDKPTHAIQSAPSGTSSYDADE